MHGSPLPEHAIHPEHSPAAAGFLDLLLFFCGRRLLMQVDGRSMEPALHPQDRVLVKRWTSGRSAPLGQIVVAWHPDSSDLRVIKRLRWSDAKGFWLEGDNPAESTDSRQLGWFNPENLIGVVVGVIPFQRSEKDS